MIAVYIDGSGDRNMVAHGRTIVADYEWYIYTCSPYTSEAIT